MRFTGRPDTASSTTAASGHVVLGGQVILRIRVRHTLTSLERVVSGSALQMVSVRVHASLCIQREVLL